MKIHLLRLILPFVAILFVPNPAAQAGPVNYFLKIDGIEGESTDEAHAKEIDLISFKAGVQQKGVTDFGSGAGASKSTFAPFQFFKSVDKATAQLFLACATGKHIPFATLSVRKIGEPSFEFLKITFRDVVVTSLNHNSAEENSDDILLETCALNFAKIEFTYIPQRPDGSAGIPVKFGFDLKKNAAFDLTPPTL